MFVNDGKELVLAGAHIRELLREMRPSPMADQMPRRAKSSKIQSTATRKDVFARSFQFRLLGVALASAYKRKAGKRQEYSG